MEEKKHKIYRIVLTGGPCAGKTTAMAKIKTTFEQDFLVYRVPEVATMTIESGVNIIPTNYDENDHSVFTKAICQQ